MPSTFIIDLQDLNLSIVGLNAYKNIPKTMFYYQAIHYVSTQLLSQDLILVKQKTIEVIFQMSLHVF
jgi:hypothetical protein